MSETKKVSIKIQGKEYIVNSTEDEEYIQKIAYYLDKRMKQISKSYPTLDITKVAVLSALNVTDELFKSIKVIEKLKAKSNVEFSLEVFDEIEKIQKESFAVKDSENVSENK